MFYMKPSNAGVSNDLNIEVRPNNLGKRRRLFWFLVVYIGSFDTIGIVLAKIGEVIEKSAAEYLFEVVVYFHL